MRIEPLLEGPGPFERLFTNYGATTSLVQAAAFFEFELVLMGVVEKVMQTREKPRRAGGGPFGFIEPNAGTVTAAVEGEREIE